MLKINTKAPNFKLLSTSKETYSLKNSLGKYVVIYFYPKDDTPGCTIETNDFNKLLSKFEKLENVYMPLSIFYQTISGDYVDLPIVDQWIENDMVLTPDLSTAVCSPWAEDVTVQVICDVNDLAGNPIDIVPRNVLKKVINLYKQKGWNPIVAPEIEFYLTKPNLDPSVPVEPTLGRTGRKVASRQAYSMTAVDEYGRVIDDIYDFAEAQGFEIDTINQEGGAGQIEINLVHGDPLKLSLIHI